MAEELKQFKNEIIKHVSDKAVETQRHFDVVAEGLKHEIRLVAEGVSSANQRIDNVQKDVNKLTDRMETVEIKIVSVEGKVDKLANDMEIVKTDVAFIKNELVQKINREEFAFLEKRVSMLEAKVNQSR